MSLINDALKRARQAQPKTPPLSVPGVPLRPVEAARPRSSGPGMLLPVAVVGVLVIGFLVWWAGNRGEAGKKVAPVTTREASVPPSAATTTAKPVAGESPQQPESTPPLKAAPAVSPPVAAVPPAVTPAPSVPSVVTPPVTTSPDVSAKVPPPAIAWPKLQGIFYRPDRPSVLLNNKTVLVGERSGEFLVVAIDRQSVTLVHAGVTNLLRMAE